MALDRPKLETGYPGALCARTRGPWTGRYGTLLDKARQWNLAPTLEAGGVIVFPHAGVEDCGHQIAAAVLACLDSGADTVIVISVLHAFTQEMEDARIRVAQGGDVDARRSSGASKARPSPARDKNGNTTTRSPAWRHFWRAETAKRGIYGPRVVERYPYLAGGKPDLLARHRRTGPTRRECRHRLDCRSLPLRHRLRHARRRSACSGGGRHGTRAAQASRKGLTYLPPGTTGATISTASRRRAMHAMPVRYFGTSGAP